MPAFARALKKNLSGIGSASRTSDNKNTLAPLRHAAVLRVKNSPSDVSANTRNVADV